MSGDAVSGPFEQSDGPTVVHACKLGLEGIVSKRKDLLIVPAARPIGSK
jgi:hypothetical protein